MDRVMTGLPIIINSVFGLYEFLIVIYCLMTFFPRLYNSAIGQFVAGVVQPLLNLISRIIPTRIGLVDFSPIIALILVQVLERVIFAII